MDKNIEILGKKVKLRDLRVEDVSKEYVKWMNDQDVVKYTESRFSKHTKDSLISYVSEKRKEPDTLFLAIIENSTGKHIGNIKLGPIDKNHKTAEIGIIIGNKNFWGKGVGTESIRILCDYAFRVLGLFKITAGFYDVNIASAKAFSNAGFSVECRRKKQFDLNGKRIDGVFMGLTRE